MKQILGFGICVCMALGAVAQKGKKQIVVAVIDSGIDTLHPGLQSSLLPGGWSYLGSAKGNVHYETMELTRLLRRDSIAGDTLTADYKQMQVKYRKKKTEAEQALGGYRRFSTALDSFLVHVGKANPTRADIEAYKPRTQVETNLRRYVLEAFKKDSSMTVAKYRKDAIDEALDHFKEQLAYDLNPQFNPRWLVGDDPENTSDLNYGSPDAKGPDPLHGTHVAGIVQSVDPRIRILNVRAIPSGDERDKDVAAAIRYAVDHGARVINMSFGKSYSPRKTAVDSAVRYAMQHDVLLVHAAGNDGENIDSVANFPDRHYTGGDSARAWIEVGACDSLGNPAKFSNYGAKSVDLFAPGVDIYSTLPGGEYGRLSGTSMAAPLVAGIAAELRLEHPRKSAIKIRKMMMKRVVKKDALRSLCNTGGWIKN